MASWLKLIIAAVLLSFVGSLFLLPMIGITDITAISLGGIAFGLGLVGLIGWAGYGKMFGANKKNSMYMALAGFGIFALTTGMLGNLGIGGGTGATIYAPGNVNTNVNVPAGACAAGISNELKGLTATVTLNAYDLAAASPYASAIDMTTGCWIYKNGLFVGATSDTTAASLSGISVGDNLQIKCGSSSYYGSDGYIKPGTTEVVSGPLCIDAQSINYNIPIWTAVGESNMATVAYDNSGSTLLNAGDTGINYGDYNLSLGAAATENIYVKWKVNAANKAFRLGGIGITQFWNISSVTILGSEGFTQVATPLFMRDVAVLVNGSTNTNMTIYTTYNLWKRDSGPLLMKQWESLKVGFTVTAHATNDPVGAEVTQFAGVAHNPFNGLAICMVDSNYGLGADGNVYDDVYAHTTTQATTGITETLTSPLGKQTCVEIAAI